MKRFLTILSASLLWLSLGVPALAQVQGFPTNYPWFTNPQTAGFQQFLSNNPAVAQALAPNPGMLYNPTWRAQYPQLQSWLQANPNAWTGLRGQGYSLYNSEFTNFLSHHPGVARQLQANPELLYDPAFRNAHPELQSWLAGHPRVWRNLKAQAVAAPVAPVYGAYPRNYGEYDENHAWHDPDWWEDHHPDWAAKHHPEWAEWRAKHQKQIEHHEMQAERHIEHEHEKLEKWEQHHNGHHDHD